MDSLILVVLRRKIVFIDDKPFSFKGLPIDCRGYLVQSGFDAGIESMPSQVVVSANLTEVLEAEKKLTKAV